MSSKRGGVAFREERKRNRMTMRHLPTYDAYLNEASGDLTSKQHEKLSDAHTRELAKNSEHGVDSFNIGSSSGGDWISSRGHKERLTSRMDPKTEKVTHSWE